MLHYEKKVISHFYMEIEIHFSNTCLSLVPAKSH